MRVDQHVVVSDVLKFPRGRYNGLIVTDDSDPGNDFNGYGGLLVQDPNHPLGRYGDPFPPGLAGYSRFGAYSAAQEEALNEVMDNAVGAIRRGILALTAKTYIMLNIDSGQREATRSGLKTLSTIVDRLDGPSRGEVLAGSLAPAKWYASMSEVMKGLQSQADQFNEGSLIESVSRTVADTATDFEKAITNPVAGVSVGLIVGGIVGVIGLLWAIPKVANIMSSAKTIKQGLSGYKSRRRRKRRGYAEHEPEDALD